MFRQSIAKAKLEGDKAECRNESDKKDSEEKSLILKNVGRVIEEQESMLRKMTRNNDLFIKYFQSNQESKDVYETDFEIKHGDSLYDMFVKLEFAENLTFPWEEDDEEESENE